MKPWWHYPFWLLWLNVPLWFYIACRNGNAFALLWCICILWAGFPSYLAWRGQSSSPL